MKKIGNNIENKLNGLLKKYKLYESKKIKCF